MSKQLQIITQGQIQKLTLGQTGLLSLIEDCVIKNKPMNFDDVVRCYCRNIRKTYTDENYRYIKINGKDTREYEYTDYDVYQAFKEQSHIWTYTLRGMIKSWFTNTIGTLVLKGKLIVLPIINIEE